MGGAILDSLMFGVEAVISLEVESAPPPGEHLGLFWREKKHHLFFSDEASHT